MLLARDNNLDPTFAAAVRELTRICQPELVLLFGSRARGDALEDSDYDFMIVFPDGTDLDDARLACNTALRDAGIPADVLARTTSQYAVQQQDPGFLDWLVAREGHALYSTGTIAQRVNTFRVREDSRGVQLWLNRAESDYQIAMLATGSPTPVADAICFHAHACVEKLLKAMIVHHSKTYPPKTHALAPLLALVPAGLREDVVIRQACVLLDNLYPRSRYPELAMPTAADARDALASATAARERILKHPTRL